MESYSIGIIGGADGPTALLVSGDPLGTILLLATVGLVLGLVLGRFFRKRK